MGTGVSGMSFTYWSWNPDSGDTGGIVSDDWVTVEPAKQAIVGPYLIPPVGGGGTIEPTTPGASSASPSRSPSASPSTSPSRSPSTSPSVSPSASRSASPSASPSSSTSGVKCGVNYAIQSSWAGGFTTNITVTNTGTSAWNNWTVTFTLPTGVTLANGWSSTITVTGTTWTIKGPKLGHQSGRGRVGKLRLPGQRAFHPRPERHRLLLMLFLTDRAPLAS